MEEVRDKVTHEVEETFGIFEEYKQRFAEAIDKENARLAATWVHPHSVPPEVADLVLGGPLNREYSLAQLLKRPNVEYAALMTLPGVGSGVEDEQVAAQVSVQAKYDGYISRQHDDIARTRRMEEFSLSPDLNYQNVRGLTREVVQRLEAVRPNTLGQAGRISGVTPAAISVLMVHLKSRSEWPRAC